MDLKEHNYPNNILCKFIAQKRKYSLFNMELKTLYKMKEFMV